MARKSITAAIPATGAGSNSGRVTVASPDDATPRRIRAVKSSLTTKGMTFTFDINQAPQVVVDAAVLGQYAYPFEVDYALPLNIQASFSLQNTTGGALAAGDFVTIIYEV